MLAGIFIGVASILYARCDNPIVGAVLFSVGLLACLIHNTEPAWYNHNIDHAWLCTGKANYPWYALFHRNQFIAWQCVCMEFAGWLRLFAINGFFALWIGIMARLCIDCGRINDIMANKLSHPWYWILFMGFVCGILIQIGVRAYKSSSTYWPIVSMCVAAFLLLGGEHCIADAAFVGMWQSPGGWGAAISCVKLVGLSAVGNLLAGVLFCDKL